MPAVAEKLYPETVMAMAVLNANAARQGLEIEHISKLFVDLKAAGIRFPNVALRGVPAGFYSEDVESFVGRFLAAGHATARSPIIFDEAGLAVCREMVLGALGRNPDEVKRIASALHYDLEKIIPQASV